MMGVLLKMHDQSDFEDYYCPTMQDQKMSDYSDMVLTDSNPLSSFTSVKSNQLPRGSHPLLSLRIEKFVNGVSTLVATHMSTALEITTASTCTAKATNSWVIDITYNTIEPLLFLSPLIYSKTNNNAGLWKLGRLSLSLQLDPSAKRAWSSSTTWPMQIKVTSVTDCKLLMNYLSPQVTDIIAPRNVLPYRKYDIHKTPYNNPINPNTSAVVTTTSHTLQGVPSKIYICARKPLNQMTIKDSDSFLPIRNLNINFNNKPTLCSAMSPYDLYRMSSRNGSK